jgi:hypothetical protein
MPAFDFFTDFATNPFDLGFDNSLYNTPLESLSNFRGEGNLYTDFATNPFELDYTYGQGGAKTDSKDKGFFGGLTAGGLVKDLAPVGAAMLGGNLANQAANNYGESALAAIGLTKQANEDRARQNFAYGNLGLNKSAAMRIQDANQQLALQTSGPFRNKATLDAARRVGASGARGADALAGRLQFMFA